MSWPPRRPDLINESCASRRMDHELPDSPPSRDGARDSFVQCSPMLSAETRKETVALESVGAAIRDMIAA